MKIYNHNKTVSFCSEFVFKLHIYVNTILISFRLFTALSHLMILTCEGIDGNVLPTSPSGTFKITFGSWNLAEHKRYERYIINAMFNYKITVCIISPFLQCYPFRGKPLYYLSLKPQYLYLGLNNKFVKQFKTLTS